MNEDINKDLILRLKNGDESVLDTLIIQNSGLIWSIAKRYFGRGVDPEDLYQLGCLGFIKAARGYEPEFGTRLVTYAVPKIAGEIRRFLRDDGPIKVSRGTREQSLRLLNIKNELEAKLGREAQLSELSEVSGISAEEIAVCELASAPVQSLQQTVGTDGPSLENAIGDDGVEDRIIELDSLRKALNELPEREKQVIILRYYRSMTQEQVARIMKVSQVQVSRIEHKAMDILKNKIS